MIKLAARLLLGSQAGPQSHGLLDNEQQKLAAVIVVLSADMSSEHLQKPCVRLPSPAVRVKENSCRHIKTSEA